ncbi:uncharacterized protein OCT59_019056 [Rhizophagus irregularis]|uniref:uncharacterized protein n=1 Tax=Rhizophagus irregularis TaxID=588596 RepID=UPI000CAF29E8|nr:hypothetical protein OCT59_019056 [Rhizophagus irregularis]GBC34066.1 hypothetical protein GLOIN_2v1771878 [Rhizophagus irregularis DAOM 181602=DAOM 197198]
MSCSKIFSGDLPELIYEIIKYFQNDYSTLYSCILVNKLWCRLAIPLLWKDPFSIPTKNYNFIENYLHNLNDDFKTKLNEYKIINNSLPSNMLFNYSRFLKYLNINKFIFTTRVWFESSISKNRLVIDFENLGDICVSLFETFIENEVNLHTLEIEIYYHACFDNILKLILKNTNFIYNIRNLNLCIDSLSIYNSDECISSISQIINLQQNLKKISLNYYGFPLLQPLLLSKDYNYSNTLNTIIFYGVDFIKVINNLKKVFERLNVLESVHIYYCYSLNTSFTQQIINLTKPFKLKSLFISESSNIDESLEILLQKSGDYLENFGVNIIESSLKQRLLELITKYCKNIKFLDFNHGYEIQIIYQLFNLIKNIKQNLNYLSINLENSSNGIEYCSIILQKLGQILPPKLEYLCLNFYYIKVSDLEVFLKNSQDTFIEKLLINNSKGQAILPSIKKYIMNKKRVKYLAIKEPHFLANELISFKGEVNKFRLYNIEVKSYDGLKINSDNYIKEID